MGALHPYFANLFKKTHGAIAAHAFFSFKIFLFPLRYSFHWASFISLFAAPILANFFISPLFLFTPPPPHAQKAMALREYGAKTHRLGYRFSSILLKWLPVRSY